MIDHKHKCIFIHIPRTGGSSIEKWLHGRDWWLTDPPTKHLLASQAKKIYKSHWNDYFKFSIVRHPISRLTSCLTMRDYFGLALDNAGDMLFEHYHRLYGDKIVIEFDYRFYDRATIERSSHQEACIYGNILDEELDYVGRFEDYAGVIRLLKERTGTKQRFCHHAARSETKPRLNLSKQTLQKIHHMYFDDMRRFGYELDQYAPPARE